MKKYLIILVSLLFIACSGDKSVNKEIDKGDKIVFTDLTGKEIVLDRPATRVFVGFYFESFFAVNGKESINNIVSMSKAEWRDFFNSQWKVYTEVMPELETIPDTGSIY